MLRHRTHLHIEGESEREASTRVNEEEEEGGGTRERGRGREEESEETGRKERGEKEGRRRERKRENERVNDETGGRGGSKHAGKQLPTRTILDTLARGRAMKQRGQREEKRREGSLPCEGGCSFCWLRRAERTSSSWSRRLLTRSTSLFQSTLFAGVPSSFPSSWRSLLSSARVSLTFNWLISSSSFIIFSSGREEAEEEEDDDDDDWDTEVEEEEKEEDDDEEEPSPLLSSFLCDPCDDMT